MQEAAIREAWQSDTIKGFAEDFEPQERQKDKHIETKMQKS